MPRRRIPNEVHRKLGSYRPARHGQELVRIAGRPTAEEIAEPPAGLHPDAADLWRWVAPDLVKVGLLDRVDLALFEAMCTLYARSIQARRVIETEGLFTQGSVGQLREHPALRIERESTAAFWKMAQDFGISPVARTRLAVGELHRQSLAVELQEALGVPTFHRVEPGP